MKTLRLMAFNNVHKFIHRFFDPMNQILHAWKYPCVFGLFFYFFVLHYFLFSIFIWYLCLFPTRVQSLYQNICGENIQCFLFKWSVNATMFRFLQNNFERIQCLTYDFPFNFPFADINLLFLIGGHVHTTHIVHL